MAADGEPGEEAWTYRGLPGALFYALLHSDSWLFMSYVVVGGLTAVVLAVTFVLALVVAMGDTFGAGGGTFTFTRAFVLFVGFLVVVPVVAPILLVARRHRRGDSTVRYDRALAASGYLFVPALYLLLVISAPPGLREQPTGDLAPVVRFLYDLPPAASVLPPLLAATITYLVHRRYAPRES